jgi:hypothetical protein
MKTDDYGTSKAIGDTANGGDEPGVTMRRHTAKTALLLAEQEADAVNARLREVEQERDAAARHLGELQRKVDELLGERAHRSRHVRDILAASS